ncbi:MAG: tetratricopeptide repeat protein, partial [Nitrospirae bacterium]|nr:tetratricopeptide repeat protein [Nitrospirota bacterium]
GFIVSPDGAVVTNYHVISNAKDIKVKVGDKVLDVEGLIYTDKENDLGILKAKGEKLPVVKLGDIANANVGEKVYVISSPEGLENTISDGLLSGIREITSDKKILQITAPISPGSSGGPVFNKNGEVIGVATFLIKEAQNLNFAMPVNLVKDKNESKKVIALRENGIEDYEKTAEYWFDIGFAYGESGQPKEAIEAFKQAIRINPDYEEAYYNLGNADYKSGQYKEAIDAYKQAIRIKPDLAEAHNGLGAAYGKLGMHKEAIEAFKHSIRIEPDIAETHTNLGANYGMEGLYKEAIEEYKQAIRIKPYYTNAHYGLGLTYFIMNDRGSALEEIKILQGLDPYLSEKLFNRIYK